MVAAKQIAASKKLQPNLSLIKGKLLKERVVCMLIKKERDAEIVSSKTKKEKAKVRPKVVPMDCLVPMLKLTKVGTRAKQKVKDSKNSTTFALDPDGWNVRPLSDFSNTHGGVYICEKEEQAKRIAEQGVGRNYPIGIVAPFPMKIGVKQPESICVEFIKQNVDHSQKISMQAYLHQITYADVEYRKTAPAVNIQKPSVAKSSVCYLTFSDSGACAQTQIEIEQK